MKCVNEYVYKGVSKNMIPSGQTGYPSIDKPWLKYHRSSPIRELNVNQKLCSMIKQANKDNLDSPAINYLGITGNDWTYRELFEMVDRLSSAYIAVGVKPGDTILILTISGVEEAVNLLAINQIGAISKWVDVTSTEEDVLAAIKNDNCKNIVCFAPIINKYENAFDDAIVERVLYVEPQQYVRKSKILKSGVNGIGELVKLKNNSNIETTIPDNSKYVSFTKFVSSGANEFTSFAVYSKDAPALMIQSSGTTGKPKTIVHTDYSINCSINKLTGIDLPLYEGNALLKIAPSWVGYGLINSMASGLALGMKVITYPGVDADLLCRMNGKYDVTFAVPYHYRYLAEHIDDIKNMTRPLALVSGGDKISAKEVIDFQNIYASKGCNAPILNGAGSNEILGAGCVNPLGHNRPGSIGVPLYKDVVSIFDSDTLEEKTVGECGEICYLSDAAFQEYDGDVEQTATVKRMHADGKIWIHTKDLGYMDSDGFIYISGRLSRVITVGGFKIAASSIEDVIQECEYVKECVAVAVPDKEQGEVPAVFIVLKNNISIENVEDEINKYCKERIKGRALPQFMGFLDQIPYTSNNKQDYKKLEHMAKDMFCSDRFN